MTIQKPAPLPSLSDLAAVEYDRARSTPWHERYTVASGRNTDVRYTTVYDVAKGMWSCNGEWCGRARWCKHRQKAAILKEAIWWERQLTDASPAELRVLIPTKQQQIKTDLDVLSAAGCLNAIAALLLAADEVSEAA